MKQKPARLCLVAIDVRSAHNVGALFRSCDGFGAELWLVGISPRPHQAKDERLPHISRKADDSIAKTALGAEKSVKWRYFESFDDCISQLRSETVRIVALEQASASKNIRDLKINNDTALLLGREVEGLSFAELAHCDAIYEIPMLGLKESFNVAVAAGIALYQARS